MWHWPQPTADLLPEADGDSFGDPGTSFTPEKGGVQFMDVKQFPRMLPL